MLHKWAPLKKKKKQTKHKSKRSKDWSLEAGRKKGALKEILTTLNYTPHMQTLAALKGLWCLLPIKITKAEPTQPRNVSEYTTMCSY